ncbi:MAG: HAMP domain-containing protein [Alphaproteobacteria bacterium]|nr:HAMP domain-containing protein [Alphaproteobacteria bacterium]
MIERVSLRARILAAFLLSFAFFLGALAYGLSQLQAVGEGLTVMNQGYVPLARVATRLDASLPRIDVDAERLLRDEPRRIPGHRSNLVLYSGLISAAVDQGRETVEHTIAVVKDDNERANLVTLDLQLRTIAEHSSHYDALSGQLLDLIEAGELDEARALQPALVKAQQALRNEIEQFSSRVENRIRRASERTAAVQRRALLVSGGLAAAALGFGVAMLVLAVFALRPIGRLTDQVQRIAGGATGARVEVTRRDELGVLAEEVNAMARAIEQRDEVLRTRAAELDRARAELRQVLDAIRLGLLVVSDDRVALANPAAAELWGAREGERLPPELLLDADRADALRIGARLFDLRQVPFRRGFILVGEDVTELVRNRDRLARSERLALIGQMLAQITHEVRNPLNAMSLNVELLTEDLADLPPDRRDEAQEILGTVTDEIRRLEQVTEHYLTLARRPRPALEPVDPAALVRSVARLLDEELRRAGVHLEIEAEAAGLVEMDGDQVRRALLNVVRNAVEAGAGHVLVTLERDDEELRLAVRDDGPGMSPEEAERAFDPFFSTKARGSGLGLAITRQILDDHGGTVRVEPVPKGTRLVLAFPTQE